MHRAAVVDVLSPTDLLRADALDPHRLEVADLVVAAGEHAQQHPGGLRVGEQVLLGEDGSQRQGAGDELLHQVGLVLG